jgi:hypothetical protein
MKKTIFYILFVFVAAVLSFLVIQKVFVKKPLSNDITNENGNNTSSWKTYQFDKQYKNAALHFKLSYPQEWQFKEEGESVKWYSKENQNVFTVSWLNPDVLYDIENICRFGMCNKVSEVSTSGNITIEIWKPTSERQRTFNLPDTFLQGKIINSTHRIIPEFTTEFLSIDDFKTILVTFSFTDHE